MIRSLSARITVLLIVLLAFFSVNAEAYQLGSFRLRIEDPTTGMGRVLTDNVSLGLGNLAGDANSAAGTIYFAGTLETFSVSILATSSTANPDGTGGGILTLAARVSSSSSSAASLLITLEDAGYNPPAPPVTFTGTIGGYDATNKAVTDTGDLIGGAASVSLQSWLDTTNNVPDFGSNTGTAKLGAMTVPLADGSSATAFSSTQTFNATGFAESGQAVPISAPGATYSIVSQATVAFSGAGSADFSLTAADPKTPKLVPEPTSLLLLGSAMLGLGLLGRKKLN